MQNLHVQSILWQVINKTYITDQLTWQMEGGLIAW